MKSQVLNTKFFFPKIAQKIINYFFHLGLFEPTWANSIWTNLKYIKMVMLMTCFKNVHISMYVYLYLYNHARLVLRDTQLYYDYTLSRFRKTYNCLVFILIRQKNYETLKLYRIIID